MRGSDEQATEILYGSPARLKASAADPVSRLLTAEAAELRELLNPNQQLALQVLDKHGELATHEFHPYLWKKTASLRLSSDLLFKLVALDLVIDGSRSVGVGSVDTWQISPTGRQILAALKGKDA